MEIHIVQNAWTVLFMVAAIQGLLLGPYLISRDQRALGLIILCYSLLLSYYVLYWTGLSKQVSPFFGILGGLTILIAPLYYSLITKVRLSALHYSPIIFFLIISIASSFNSLSLDGWVPIFQVGHLLTYSMLIVKVKEKSKWQNNISLSYNVFTAGFTLYYILVWTGLLKIEYDYFISMIMTGFIYWIGYKALFNPDTQAKNESKTMAYSNAFAESVTNKIEGWIESQQRFLDSEYKITDLSSELDTSVHTLSHIINVKYGRGFNDWLNERRINHAKSLISENPDEKLITIAYQSGFNNKVSFIKNFKKHVGMTPTAFKASIKG